MVDKVISPKLTGQPETVVRSMGGLEGLGPRPRGSPRAGLSPLASPVLLGWVAQTAPYAVGSVAGWLVHWGRRPSGWE